MFRSLLLSMRAHGAFTLLIFLYSFALLLALAIGSPWWLWKIATTRKYREGLGERLGRLPPRLYVTASASPVIWVHAVSVGEVIAVSGLVRELSARAPGYRVMVSTTTRTGQAVARERFGQENVFYYPLDFAFAVRRYLRALRPRLLVLAETEFWPRMLTECRNSAVPVAVVNARISDRSYPRYLRLRFLWRRILRALSVVLAQTAEDAARLLAIGIPPDRVRLGGNLKYDVRTPPASVLTAQLSSALPASAKVLVCGSTLDGEERLLLDVWPGLLAAELELRMVLAPRHPERFAAVANLLKQNGLRWFRRSEWPLAGREFAAGSILLLDTIGELASLYSLATVAFVGGSLVAAGGHNPLEPAQFSVPIVMGPNYENFRGIVERLAAGDAIRIVEPPALGGALLELIRNRNLSVAMGNRAREVFDAESGPTTRAVKALLALLPGGGA